MLPAIMTSAWIAKMEVKPAARSWLKSVGWPCALGRPAIRGDDHTLVATAADRSVNGRSRIPEPRGLPRKSLRVLAQNVMHTGGTRLPPAVARSSCFVGFFERLGFLGESPSLSAISY